MIIEGSYKFLKFFYLKINTKNSLGVVMYILLSGLPPFMGSNKTNLFENIMTCNFNFKASQWQYISKEAKELITKLI